jgi:hypothetical protein
MAAQRPRLSRRFALAGCLALICSLFALASPAFGAFENTPTATVEGPIPVTETSHPYLATDIPLANYGYEEDEYFITGLGYQYTTGGALTANGVKVTTGGPNSNGTYPFKTRIVVRRPINPANFNGKVVAEWSNVTAGHDLEANWFGDPYYLLKNGYAWVGVSAQAVGTNYLKNTFNPTRYAGLEVGPSGDGLSFDIYAAAIKAIRGFGNGVQPLGSLTPNITKVTASGESQSCGRLVTYFNKIAPLQEGIVDNYLMTVCTNAIRTDRPEKVLRIITEFENKAQQTEAEAPTNPSLRHWEAAGGSHVPYLAVANWGKVVDRDSGEELAKCENPALSHVQWPYLVNAGTKELDEWSEGGASPPLAPRGVYTNSTTLKRNAQGNALGGIQLPDMAVATAVNRGDNTAAPPPNPYAQSAFCILLGQNKPFSAETLSGLYSDYGDYVDKVKAVAEERMSEGFLLPEDVIRIVDSAEEFSALRPTVPVLTGASKNTGSFQLSWRGAVPSHEQSVVASLAKTKPTFEVQHSNAGGEWTTVASGLSSPNYSFANEQEGTWSYRVRSTTVVPAFKFEPEVVNVTPWSNVLSNVVVDKTAPNVSVSADRPADYAGGGGWYKDTVTLSFTANDPLLADGSPGTGVNPATVPAPQVFNTDGSHEASSTVADNVGNVSAAVSLAVQVDASAPAAAVNCPASVAIGAPGVQATVTASDGQSGLAVDPSGTVPIDTKSAGPKVTSATAIDNVGHETPASCVTLVGGFTQVISGNVKGKLVIKSGQVVQITATAKISGTLTVKAGGAVDVEGAKLSGTFSAKGATFIRMCGVTASGPVKAINGSGAVILGQGDEECSANTFNGAVTVKGNQEGVLINGNAFGSNLKVQNNAGGTTVANNTVAAGLTVTGNTGAVVDTPNEVEGKSKLQ